MRAYVTTTNLRNAIALGGFVSVLALPRIFVFGGESAALLGLAVFPLMVFVAGCVTAWGSCGGMAGAFPEGTRQRRWRAAALVLGLLASAGLYAFDDDVQQILAATSSLLVIRLAFPPTIMEALALVFWSAGFETLFFRASAMSLFSRLSGRYTIAIVGTVILRVAVMWFKESAPGVMTIDRVISIGFLSAIACVLYARGGLPAAMIFSAAVNSRHIVRVALEGRE
jgi:hypothetical protein